MYKLTATFTKNHIFEVTVTLYTLNELLPTFNTMFNNYSIFDSHILCYIVIGVYLHIKRQ